MDMSKDGELRFQCRRRQLLVVRCGYDCCPEGSAEEELSNRMSVLQRIARKRIEFERETRDMEERSLLSAASWVVHTATRSAITRHVKGKVLDIGCGTQPYREMIISTGAGYEGLDIEKRCAHLDYQGDALNLPIELKGKEFDCVLGLMVWEHLPDPMLATRNVRKLLAEGGILVLSVPHLSRLHEIPNDYFRFTRYGLQSMLRQEGFEPVEIVPCGGILSFIGHQVSTVFVCLSRGIPGIQQLVFLLNKYILVYPLIWLDRWIDREGLLPLAYVAVARVPGRRPGGEPNG